jgi:hypothetical protein
MSGFRFSVHTRVFGTHNRIGFDVTSIGLTRIVDQTSAHRLPRVFTFAVEDAAISSATGVSAVARLPRFFSRIVSSRLLRTNGCGARTLAQDWVTKISFSCCGETVHPYRPCAAAFSFREGSRRTDLRNKGDGP